MGSSVEHLHIHWVLIALLCGVFYLIFDALRSFALQLSPGASTPLELTFNNPNQQALKIEQLRVGRELRRGLPAAGGVRAEAGALREPLVRVCAGCSTARTW